MPTYAVIPDRNLLIAVQPNGGWSSADDGTPGSMEVAFRLEITDDGNSNYLLNYASLDGKYATDEWHETLAGAYESATERFGIESSEWTGPSR